MPSKRKLRRWVLVAAGGAALLVLLAWVGLHFVPLPRSLLDPVPAQVRIVDRNGQPLRTVRSGNQGFGRPVTYSEVPQSLIQATVSAEDKRFWSHHGVDWRAYGRAAWQLVRYRRVLSGGSTITQQLIKVAEPRSRTFSAKILEAVQAMRLEQAWSKQRILAAYLNRIDYGNMNVGCAAAAEFYFGKPLEQLSVSEAALLAGIPQAPSRLNPLRSPEKAASRQAWILGRMHANGYLSDAELVRAKSETSNFASPRRAFKAPHFVDLLLVRASSDVAFCRQLAAETDRGTVHTTLDLEWNAETENIMRRQLQNLRDQNVHNGAAVVLDNRSGGVRVLVGSEDYFDRRSGQVNGAWAGRSAGSTFKPFTYLIALGQGATPATVFADVPAEFATATGVFAPLNYDRQWRGPVRLRHALANSLNVPAVRALEQIGGASPLLDKLRACGLSTLTGDAQHYGLGLTIGNAEARLLELANAYACLARLGLAQPWTCLNSSPATPRRIFDETAAFLIADILSDNDARAAAFGVDSPLRFNYPVAVKTGTSSNFRDNWAFGYTPEFTVGVWVGNFDGQPMREVSGVTGAAPIMHEIIEMLARETPPTWYAEPSELIERRIHPLNGKLARHPPLTDSSAYISEKFIAGHLPPAETPADYDPTGRVRLGPEYRTWLASTRDPLADKAFADPAPDQVKILFPLPGTVFYLDRDLPDNGGRIQPRIQGDIPVRWTCETMAVTTSGGTTTVQLRPGTHTVWAETLSEKTSAQIEVRQR